MFTRLFTFLLLLISFGFTVYDPIHSFRWLEGIWVMQKGEGKQRVEIWSKKDSNTLSGVGLKVNGEDTIVLENLILSYKDDAYWYIPTVPDQNDAQPVPFKMTKRDALEVTFENPEHDFPQRIIYSLKPLLSKDPSEILKGDSLIVRVESLAGKSIRYGFVRQ